MKAEPTTDEETAIAEFKRYLRERQWSIKSEDSRYVTKSRLTRVVLPEHAEQAARNLWNKAQGKVTIVKVTDSELETELAKSLMIMAGVESVPSTVDRFEAVAAICLREIEKNTASAILLKMVELENEAKQSPNKMLTYEVLWNKLKKHLKVEKVK